MPPSLDRISHGIAILAAALTAFATTLPAQAQEALEPHLIHEYEGKVALAVVILSLAAAGVLVRRAVRR